MVLSPTSDRWEDCDVERVRYWDHFRIGSGILLSEVIAEAKEALDENWMEVIGYVVREDDKWLVVMERWDNIQRQGEFMYILKSDIFERVVLVAKGVST